MTDKIFPTWINDRLPTEEEKDVLIFKDGNITGIYGYGVVEGQFWCIEPKIPDGYSAYKFIQFIATPQECLDREQGESGHWIDSTVKEVHSSVDAEKIKDLEQALAQVKEENKDLAKAWKTLKDFNDATDNQEDEEIARLKSELDKEHMIRSGLVSDCQKSEERVEEMEEEYCQHFDSNPGLRQEVLHYKNLNTLLKNVLRMEWGG